MFWYRQGIMSLRIFFFITERSNGYLQYVEGTVATEHCDPDRLSFPVLLQSCALIGVKNVKLLFYFATEDNENSPAYVVNEV